MKKVISYIVNIIIPLAVGGLSALVTMNNMNIYSQINTPPLSPPSILFPIVWSILFTLMGVSSGLIFNSNSAQKNDALFVYALSLIVNFTWSIIFFNLRKFLIAFVILLALLALILATIVKYFRINKVSAYLQIPYLIWVAFAGYLNIAIYFLN